MGLWFWIKVKGKVRILSFIGLMDMSSVKNEHKGFIKGNWIGTFCFSFFPLSVGDSCQNLSASDHSKHHMLHRSADSFTLTVFAKM